MGIEAELKRGEAYHRARRALYFATALITIIQFSVWFGNPAPSALSVPGFGDSAKLPVHAVVIFIWFACCLFGWEFWTEYAETRAVNSEFARKTAADQLELQFMARVDPAQLNDALGSASSEVSDLKNHILAYIRMLSERFEYIKSRSEQLITVMAANTIELDDGTGPKFLSGKDYVERWVSQATTDLRESADVIGGWALPEIDEAIEAYREQARLLIIEFHKLSDAIVRDQRVGFEYRDKYVAILSFGIASFIAIVNLFEVISASPLETIVRNTFWICSTLCRIFSLFA